MKYYKEDLNEIVALARDDLRALSNASIFITGGTGFIGSWIVEALVFANSLLHLDLTIAVLTRDAIAARRAYANLPGNTCITVLAGEIAQFDFPPGKFTHVIHAATPASAQLNTESPLDMLDIIVLGTRRVLEFVVYSGASAYLHLSSGAVYGIQPAGMGEIPEDYAGAPLTTEGWSAYGEGKRLAELLGTIYSKKYNFRHQEARIFALVGPGLPLNIHYAMGNFIRDAMEGGPIKIGGDGTPVRSYLYMTDLVNWLLAILVRGGTRRIYNVGSDRSLTIAETAAVVNRVSGDCSQVEIARRAVPGQGGGKYVPCIQRAREDLQLSATIPLEEGIRRTINWNKGLARDAAIRSL